MKTLLTVIAIVLSLETFSQPRQFAVVRPDGTTYICPTWDSVYSKAIDGDNIYLPGSSFTITNPIAKRLNIFGAGIHPDSTSVTNTTQLNGTIIILPSASGGSLTGIANCELLQFGTSASNQNISNYTISRCNLGHVYLGSVAPGSSTNITFSENIIAYMHGFNTTNNVLQKNIIGILSDFVYNNSFRNNIFLGGFSTCLNGGSSASVISVSNCIFENNVFITSFSNIANCIFNNNLFVQPISFPSSTNIGSNNISNQSQNSIFINQTGGAFSYTDNYHLKASCPGVMAGTDGTDVGIYGTTQPTSEGWVPVNPHIYFKQIAPQTGNDGKLNVQIKVRTNN